MSRTCRHISESVQLLWTWDTTEQSDLWTAVDANGLLERALSPTRRPDPCARPG